MTQDPGWSRDRERAGRPIREILAHGEDAPENPDPDLVRTDRVGRTGGPPLGPRLMTRSRSIEESAMEARRTRVLIVDDQKFARHIVVSALGRDPRIEIVGNAGDVRGSLENVERLGPDVVVLDLEMPLMRGLEMLAELRRRAPALPVIVLSASNEAGAIGTLAALQTGASDHATKPSERVRVADAVDSLQLDLIPKILALHDTTSRSRVREPVLRPAPKSSGTPREATRSLRTTSPESSPEIVAIGTSTGGPRALQAILPELPSSFPVPIVIVQHMPATFTTALARNLDQVCRLQVREAYEGAEIRAGEAWIAPGDHHMTVERTESGGRLHLDQGPKECSCRPAVDPLFRSVAKTYGALSLAVVLTGMGSDGLEGARALHQIGARIVVQDEPTSIVWGMPGCIANARLASEVLAQDEIAAFLERSVARPALSGDRLA